jgi:hypothetical protein
VVLKLKLNHRGRQLLKQSGGTPVAVTVRATIRTSSGSVKLLEKILRIVRR